MTNNLVVVEPDFVSIVIPPSFLNTYYRIIAITAEHGEESIQNSKKPCKNKSYDILDCSNLFNAALACVKVNKLKLSQTILKYIDAQLDLIYPDVETPEVEELAYDYIYLDIPAKYIFTFYSVMQLMSLYGEEVIKDCKASCSNVNKDIIGYFNIFYAGITAISNGKTPVGEALIEFVNSALSMVYPYLINKDSFVFYADNNSLLKVLVQQSDNGPVFKIDEDDMEIYADVFKSNTFPLVFPFSFTT